MTPPLIDADSAPGVVEKAPRIPSRAAVIVSGRVAQLACAVAVAPFAILTALFTGGDPV